MRQSIDQAREELDVGETWHRVGMDVTHVITGNRSNRLRADTVGRVVMSATTGH